MRKELKKKQKKNIGKHSAHIISKTNVLMNDFTLKEFKTKGLRNNNKKINNF